MREQRLKISLSRSLFPPPSRYLLRLHAILIKKTKRTILCLSYAGTTLENIALAIVVSATLAWEIALSHYLVTRITLCVLRKNLKR